MSARDGAYNKCQPEHAPGGCVRRVASVSAEVSAEARCRRRRGAHARSDGVESRGRRSHRSPAFIDHCPDHSCGFSFFACIKSLRWLAALA
jgi:hypothetical protein